MRLSAAAPWLTAALSLAAGLAAALAFPPFGVLPGLLGYGLLMGLCDRAAEPRPIRSAFWRGWLAGTAFFLVATWWVFEAFQVDAANQGWMAPFAVALLAAGLGLFWGAAGAAYRWLNPQGPLRLLVFAGAFCLLEWVRGHLLTGFPWDLAGESWRAGSAPSQAAALMGAYALSWVTVAIFAAPALLFDATRGRAHTLALALAVLALAGLYSYGAIRLAHPAQPAPNAPVVRVVQANVDERPTYDADAVRDIFGRYLRLTVLPAARAPDIVIWPEGAIPAAANDYLAERSWTRAAIAGALKPGQSLLQGAYRVAGTPQAPLYYNTLIALRADPGGLRDTGLYDKFRLVPFGEYLPLDSLLSRLGIKKLVHVGDGFSSGPPPRPIAPQGVPPVQPLICYESLFPGFARQGARLGGRPAWIVNVSDDAWFGRTYGPLQHLNLASYRAIEEGLPIVRATPTGVSAVIDAYGRIAPGKVLGQGAMGVIDAPLPPALSPTPFSRWGESLFAAMMALSAAAATFGLALPGRWRKKR
jgi:apolipoprotein N-acyltransferase